VGAAFPPVKIIFIDRKRMLMVRGTKQVSAITAEDGEEFRGRAGTSAVESSRGNSATFCDFSVLPLSGIIGYALGAPAGSTMSSPFVAACFSSSRSSSPVVPSRVIFGTLGQSRSFFPFLCPRLLRESSRGRRGQARHLSSLTTTRHSFRFSDFCCAATCS